MNQRQKGLMIGTACLALAVAAWAAVALRPVIIETWYLHRLRTGSEAERQAAEERLLAMGSPAMIPVLLGRHLDETHRFYHPEAPPPPGFHTPYRERPRKDFDKLKEFLCRTGQAALPVLSGLLEDPESEAYGAVLEVLEEARDRAAFALPLLLRDLNRPDPYGRAIDVIGSIGPAALAASPSLVRVMEENPELRVPAALVLKKVGAPADLVLPSLEKILRTDQDPYSRLRAIESLRFLGGYAASAAPFLVKLLADPSQRIRFEADHALHRLGGAAVPSLVRGLADPSALVREACAQNLGEVGVPPGDAAQALERLLSDPDAEVRRAAATALAKTPGK